jgi:hypothetical protein
MHPYAHNLVLAESYLKNSNIKFNNLLNLKADSFISEQIAQF